MNWNPTILNRTSENSELCDKTIAQARTELEKWSDDPAESQKDADWIGEELYLIKDELGMIKLASNIEDRNIEIL